MPEKTSEQWDTVPETKIACPLCGMIAFFSGGLAEHLNNPSREDQCPNVGKRYRVTWPKVDVEVVE